MGDSRCQGRGPEWSGASPGRSPHEQEYAEFCKPNSYIYCTIYSFGFHYPPAFNKKVGASGEERELWETKRQGITLADLQTGSYVCAGGGEDEDGAVNVLA